MIQAIVLPGVIHLILYLSPYGYSPKVLNPPRKARGETILNFEISVFKLVLSISRRSLSPVIRKSALAAAQHSRSILSSLSLQIDNLFFGVTTLALITNEAIPERSDLN